MACSPSFVFSETIVEEYLEQRVQLRVFRRNNSIEAEQRIVIKYGRQSQSSRYGIESGRL